MTAFQVIRAQIIINALGGDDYLNGEAGADVLQGAAGDDVLLGGLGQDTLTGGEGNDVLYGQGGQDSLFGSEGVDTLHGGEGDDVLIASSEGDYLSGDQGNDTLQGNRSNDYLVGGSGEDKIIADDGADTIYAGADADAVFAEQGDDVVHLEGGDDYAVAGLGDDTVLAGAGNDIVLGDDKYGHINGGNDTLFGESGNDLLFGGHGNDSLFGGSGSDFLLGEEGDDYLDGGEGSDFYVFSGDFGQDIVNEGKDKQSFDELIFDGIDYQNLWFELVGADLLISEVNTDNQVLIKDFNRYNVNLPDNNELSELLENAALDQTPINSVRVDTHSLSATNIFLLIDAMSSGDATQINEVRESVWQPETLTGLQARFEYAPEIFTQNFFLQEDDTFSGQIVASDENQLNDLHFELMVDADQGAINVNSDGSFTFIPSANFSGLTAAKVRVTDSTGLYSEATLNFAVEGIEHINDATAPTEIFLNGESNLSIKENTEADTVVGILLKDSPETTQNFTYSVQENENFFVNAQGRVSGGSGRSFRL